LLGVMQNEFLSSEGAGNGLSEASPLVIGRYPEAYMRLEVRAWERCRVLERLRVIIDYCAICCDILSLCLSWCVQIILRPFFKKYDKNNDGHLSIQELAVVFK
jgi:hypothetical protein